MFHLEGSAATPDRAGMPRWVLPVAAAGMVILVALLVVWLGRR